MAAKTNVMPAPIEAPLPLESLRDYAREIFDPIKRGESVATVWVPMAGRRVRNKFIISYPQLFEDSVADSYLLVYIDPLELTEETSAGYIKLIVQSVIESFKNKSSLKLANPDSYYTAGDYSELLGHLRELLKEVATAGLETVLFLGEFDEMQFADSVFYNNLKSLWVGLASKLHYIFLLQQDLSDLKKVAQYGDLNEVLLKNIIYIPLLSEGETNYLIDYFAKEFKRDFSEDERRVLFEVCGGHPYFIKSCTRLIALMNGHKRNFEELKKILVSHFELQSAASHLLELLPEEQVNALRNIANSQTRELPQVLDSLERMRMVVLKKGVWVPFGELFRSVLEAQFAQSQPQDAQANGQTFQIINGSIFIAGVNVEDKFTRQEYEVLNFLLSDPEKLRSRDEIGEAMWGKLAYEKYSDWAIDQSVSKIRKKLKEIGADKYLVTVRGRGYKLSID